MTASSVANPAATSSMSPCQPARRPASGLLLPGRHRDHLLVERLQRREQQRAAVGRDHARAASPPAAGTASSRQRDIAASLNTGSANSVYWCPNARSPSGAPPSARPSGSKCHATAGVAKSPVAKPCRGSAPPGAAPPRARPRAHGPRRRPSPTRAGSRRADVRDVRPAAPPGVTSRAGPSQSGSSQPIRSTPRRSPGPGAGPLERCDRVSLRLRHTGRHSHPGRARRAIGESGRLSISGNPVRRTLDTDNEEAPCGT